MANLLPSVSVFFPCLNEAENIPVLLQKAMEYLPTVTQDYEILIIDDGSTDDTISIVDTFRAHNTHIRCISHEKNLGYGAALRTGIKQSKKRWIFWMDGDQQFDIRTLDKLIPYCDTYQAIIGYRAHRADTFLRKVNGELYTQLINMLFGLRVRDIDCAFKLISADILRDLPITTSSAFTSAEILIRLKKRRVKFKQVPVPHFPRKFGKPSGGSLHVIAKGLRETVSFFVHQHV